MYAALHDREGQTAQFADDELACVACDRGARETGNFGVGDACGAGELIGEGAEAGAEDEREFGAELGARLDEFGGAGGAGEGVGGFGWFLGGWGHWVRVVRPKRDPSTSLRMT